MFSSMFSLIFLESQKRDKNWPAPEATQRDNEASRRHK